MMHPTALIVYNRPRYLFQILQALKRDLVEPLYVFCDGPSTDKDVVVSRELVAGISWTEPAVIEREENIGLAQSVVSAIDYVLGRHETVIVLEDDCLPGPRFFEFMYKCLDKYQNNEQVMAVNGYVSFEMENCEGCLYQAVLLPHFECWGWGTWRRAWNLYIRDNELRSMQIPKGMRRRGFIEAKIGGNRDVWSPGWFVSLKIHDGLCICPVATHITNLDDGGLVFQQDSRPIRSLPLGESDNVLCKEKMREALENGYTRIKMT